MHQHPTPQIENKHHINAHRQSRTDNIRSTQPDLVKAQQLSSGVKPGLKPICPEVVKVKHAIKNLQSLYSHQQDDHL